MYFLLNMNISPAFATGQNRHITGNLATITTA